MILLFFTESRKTQDNTEFDGRSDISSTTELSADFYNFTPTFTDYFTAAKPLISVLITDFMEYDNKTANLH